MICKQNVRKLLHTSKYLGGVKRDIELVTSGVVGEHQRVFVETWKIKNNVKLQIGVESTQVYKKNRGVFLLLGFTGVKRLHKKKKNKKMQYGT